MLRIREPLDVSITAAGGREGLGDFLEANPRRLLRLSNRGGRLTHTLCGDPKRFCVLIPAHPATWNTLDNKEAVYVIPVGY